MAESLVTHRIQDLMNTNELEKKYNLESSPWENYREKLHMAGDCQT